MMAGLTDHQFDTDLYRIKAKIDRPVAFDKPQATAKIKWSPCISADGIAVVAPISFE